MAIGCLYLLTSPSGKEYLGITRRGIAERFKRHQHNAFKLKYATALHNALR